MLIIRLQRTGKKNQANFRIVLAEKTAAAQKKFQEVLGNYNPGKKTFKAVEERVKYWLSQNVAISPTVHNLFVTKGLLQGAKVRAFSVPKKETPAEAGIPAAATPTEASPAEVAAPVENPPAENS